MKIVSRVLVIVMAFSMLLTFAACGASSADLIGTWKCSGHDSIKLVFSDDGTCEYYTGGESTIVYNYAIEGDQIKLTMSGVIDENNSFISLPERVQKTANENTTYLEFDGSKIVDRKLVYTKEQ